MVSKQITIVTYHYVRDVKYTRYPGIKALSISEFKGQIEYLARYYQFVSIQDCLDAAYYNKGDLPANAVLLTFDDGYSEHFSTVFPVLHRKGIQGCFFPSSEAILEGKVLDVNKIHFILSSVGDIHRLIRDVYDILDELREQYLLKSNESYFSELTKKETRFDSREVIFIKRLLQVGLEENVRMIVIDRLFSKYVSDDENAIAADLYVNTDQLKCMIKCGQYVGSHGKKHVWLSTLSPEQQEAEIDSSLAFLKEIGSPVDYWVMCYPYGDYNDSLIDLLKRKNCKLGLTTRVGIASLNQETLFTLSRLDTSDIPKFPVYSLGGESKGCYT